MLFSRFKNRKTLRVRGEREDNVNYRHVIGSLVRKPGAFARYRFREQMFPTMAFCKRRR